MSLIFDDILLFKVKEIIALMSMT